MPPSVNIHTFVAASLDRAHCINCHACPRHQTATGFQMQMGEGKSTGFTACDHILSDHTHVFIRDQAVEVRLRDMPHPSRRPG